jgi:hypothetical protein
MNVVSCIYPYMFSDNTNIVFATLIYVNDDDTHIIPVTKRIFYIVFCAIVKNVYVSTNDQFQGESFE